MKIFDKWDVSGIGIVDPGLKGYIEVVKERIRDHQDNNPELASEEAIQIVQNMTNSGELDQYRIAYSGQWTMKFAGSCKINTYLVS